MKAQKSFIWIKEGYELFASHGKAGLNVEEIARRVNKNKSSFYHYFGDLESFESVLLDFHITQGEEFSDALSKCNNLDPEMIQVFIDRRTDVLFHKQLRINRENKLYSQTFERVYKKLEPALLQKWKEYLGLEQIPFFAQSFLNIVSENFLLRIKESDFTYEWIKGYIDELKMVTAQMKSIQMNEGV